MKTIKNWYFARANKIFQKQPFRGVLKTKCSWKFTGEHPCPSVVSIKLQRKLVFNVQNAPESRILSSPQVSIYPAGIYLFKFNKGNARVICKIYSNLIIKTPERSYWRCFDVFIANFEHISHIALMFPLLSLNN